MKFSADICRAGIIALATVLVCSGAQAAETPDASITFNGGSVAFIAGVNWGGGTLRYKGKAIPLEVSGLTVGAVGVKKFQASGNVFNLRNVADIEGTYASIGAGATVGGGASGIAMKNGNGVLIRATSTSVGADLRVGPSGMTIKLKQ
ncbi:hypothetical protein [Phenylobacterium sp.]|uniref:hypothetical protein n=1 Tax=Phenylobacterium sp. TaxID=1871053 RepID=UPI002E364201|nr:hypothetical protein [Phenylobacterium sp.]HEX4709497.1 hypothetical protein [Phenylobacterium sp.]